VAAGFLGFLCRAAGRASRDEVAGGSRTEAVDWLFDLTGTPDAVGGLQLR